MSSTHNQYQSLSPCHLLICEDNEENLLLIEALAASFGCNTTAAINGQEAIERCSEAQYDAILMDLAMPIISGLEASKRIRTSDNLNKNTPIIAVTAEVSPLAQSASVSFGINKYISKPIDAGLLHQTIQNLIR
ncbi:response regulator [Coraliomargarita algicola]|uniref:Response regulator n=1 Tax=Coraliomargarita algicola TaxID=3092156 RepID=A0ABZ0RUD2_9BACT|nr:response regulator [Coraliomargarita sp. J2-16]WPJ96559.1 response regulator [Coraliomargarita sp. J2-16]